MAAVGSSGRRREGAGGRGRLIRFRVPFIHGWLGVRLVRDINMFYYH
jgi:hypothetical protein